MSDIYSAPKSVLSEPAEILADAPLASRWKRLGAVIIDGLIGVIWGVPLMYFLGFWENVRQGIEPDKSFEIIMTLLNAIAFVCIHGYFLKQNGQTLGKKALSIKVVGLNNHLLPLHQIVIKRFLPITVLTLVPFVGQFIAFIDSVFIFRTDKRCVHDFIAGTKVVDA